VASCRFKFGGKRSAKFITIFENTVGWGNDKNFTFNEDGKGKRKTEKRRAKIKTNRVRSRSYKAKPLRNNH